MSCSGNQVAVAMSGGVDSSVAALLLQREGANVRGIFARSWEDKNCPAREDFLAAAAAADVLGIDLDFAELAGEYRSEVFGDFLAGYAAGGTPNPDVWCNERIKFGALLAHDLVGGDPLATGHYARIASRPDGLLGLFKGEDPVKDQTYFLYRLSQGQRARARFPLAGLVKDEVRALAREAGLPNWSRRDSTGICFVGARRFGDFIRGHLGSREGAIRTPEGRVLGSHAGTWLYTVGQRRGLGLGGPGEPWYVAAKDAERNEIVAVRGREHPLLYSDCASLERTSWIAGRPPVAGRVYTAKLRHGQRPQPCALEEIGEGTCRVRFGVPQWAVAPGQSTVIYDGNACLGGGLVAGDAPLSGRCAPSAEAAGAAG